MKTPKLWEVFLAAILALISIAGYIAKLLGHVAPSYSLYVEFVPLLLFATYLFYFFIEYMQVIINALLRINSVLLSVLSFFILTILGIEILTYANLSAHENNVPVDTSRARIYNSWESDVVHDGYINAYGTKRHDPYPVIDVKQAPGQLVFSYEIDSAFPSDDQATSGLYIPFFADPVDKRLVKRLSFEIRAEKVKCGPDIGPDIGIRLVVEDPKTHANRERVIYTINSLKGHLNRTYLFDGSWQDLSIDTRDFQIMRDMTDDGRGINDINKVVFFIGTAAAKACQNNTFLLRDVRFITK